MKFEAKEDACTSGRPRSGQFEIKTSRLSSTIIVDVDIICEFDCQKVPADPLAIQCNGNGDFQCGTCFCQEQWTGPTCALQKRTCTDPYCSGRGILGQYGCECKNNINNLVYGNCCQCDESNSPTSQGSYDACSGRGQCKCKEATGEMYSTFKKKKLVRPLGVIKF